MEQLMTTKEIAKHFNVAEITIYRWREQGMPFIKIGPAGRSVRFKLDQVEEWAGGEEGGEKEKL